MGVLLTVLGVVCLAAPPALAQSSPSSEAAFGAAIAKRNCAQCHAIGDVGDSPNAKAPRFRDLHKRYVLEDLGEAMMEQMMSDHKDMPKFRMTMEELSGLIEYLKAIQADKVASRGAVAHRL